MKYSMLRRGALALALGLAGAAVAQTYPVKPVRIIVPVAAGGNVDLVARSVAQPLIESLGQQVIVENRPGASSLVGTQLVAKSAPDGYTLLAMANTFAMVPSIVTHPGYDALKDFTGVTLTCLVPQVLVVNPALPTLDEAGVPGYEDITFNGLVAPAGTPREILARLNEEVAKIVRVPALRNRFLERAVELKANTSPEEFSAYIKAEFEKKGKLARDAGIRLE